MQGILMAGERLRRAASEENLESNLARNFDTVNSKVQLESCRLFCSHFPVMNQSSVKFS